MLYFNKGANASLPTLRADAEARASLSAYASFYDSIAHLVPNFEPPSTRGAVALSLALPHGAEDAVAVLSAEGYDFQSNVLDKEAYQYWGEVDQHGQAKVEGVRPGKYRLTVYAKGIVSKSMDGEKSHMLIDRGRRIRVVYTGRRGSRVEKDDAAFEVEMGRGELRFVFAFTVVNCSTHLLGRR